MRNRALTCAALFATIPASAQEAPLRIKLQWGHPLYHESAREAGVTMGLSITPQSDHATELVELCHELRLVAGLGSENGDRLFLETIFVVPYKEMAVEGYYWPENRTSDTGVLVPGSGVARGTLDAIVGGAGIPPRVLDETNVQHEISCEIREPLWHLSWQDLRPIGDEDPDSVIERAYQRFMAVHQAVVAHNIKGQNLQMGQRTTSGG
jgi:hypothetical protein